MSTWNTLLKRHYLIVNKILQYYLCFPASYRFNCRPTCIILRYSNWSFKTWCKKESIYAMYTTVSKSCLRDGNLVSYYSFIFCWLLDPTNWSLSFFFYLHCHTSVVFYTHFQDIFQVINENNVTWRLCFPILRLNIFWAKLFISTENL